MKNRTLAAALLLLSACAQAAAQTQTPTPTPTPQPAQTPAARPTPSPAAPQAKPAEAKKPSDAKKKYEAMLETAKKGGGTVDYKALRLAFFETEDYSPLAGMMVYRSLWTAVAQGNWAEAARQAEAVLAKNYVDINAHMVAHVAYRQQGDEEKAKLHRRWADGLIESVKAGGDGKTPGTAWHVISTSEEYAVLRAMNLRPVGQALINADGHSYDEMKVLDPQTNAESRFYFNVDKPFSAYGRK
jgi:hypothetical protein